MIFLNHVQCYVDGMNFVSISEGLDKFLEGEVVYTVIFTDRCSCTLKPSQKIAHDIIVQAAAQPLGTSCMENEDSINLFSKLIITNG